MKRNTQCPAKNSMDGCQTKSIKKEFINVSSLLSITKQGEGPVVYLAWYGDRKKGRPNRKGRSSFLPWPGSLAFVGSLSKINIESFADRGSSIPKESRKVLSIRLLIDSHHPRNFRSNLPNKTFSSRASLLLSLLFVSRGN